MSLASADNGRAPSSRLCVLRALNPSEGYPRFNFGVAVDGTCYDIVLPSAVADWLNVCCTSNDIQCIDDMAATDTPEDLRAAIVRQTSAGDAKDNLLYGSLELEALTHVRADRLCEAVGYRYLFASQGLARRLCRDAEDDELGLELGNYVTQHKSLFTLCGGFELLVATYLAVDVEEFIALDKASEARLESAGVQDRRTFLRGLLQLQGKN